MIPLLTVRGFPCTNPPAHSGLPIVAYAIGADGWPIVAYLAPWQGARGWLDATIAAVRLCCPWLGKDIDLCLDI